MTKNLTADELEMLFDNGEDSDDLYDWDNAMIAPPVFFEDSEDLPVVIHVDRKLVDKLDRMAMTSGLSRSRYLSDIVGKMLSTA